MKSKQPSTVFFSHHEPPKLEEVKAYSPGRERPSRKQKTSTMSMSTATGVQLPESFTAAGGSSPAAGSRRCCAISRCHGRSACKANLFFFHRIKNLTLPMYYICKFSGTWLVYDGNTHTSSVLPPPQVETIRQLFPAALKETAVLDAVMVAPISASRLQQTPGAAYFICRFATTWSLYDGYTKTSKTLEPAAVQILLVLFPTACNDALVLDALMISSIPASRLQALTSSLPAQTIKKST